MDQYLCTRLRQQELPENVPLKVPSVADEDTNLSFVAAHKQSKICLLAQEMSTTKVATSATQITPLCSPCPPLQYPTALRSTLRLHALT